MKRSDTTTHDRAGRLRILFARNTARAGARLRAFLVRTRASADGRLRALLIVALFHCVAIPALAKDLPTARPEDEGLSSERLQRLNAAMQAAVEQKRIAGVVTLVARHGRVVHHEAHGLADVEARRPLRKDDLFRLYSMTKPVVSVALLMLYEEGKFQLTDPLEKYIPEFKDQKVFARLDEQGRMVLEEPKRKATIQDAFRHTLGLSAGLGPGPVNERYRELGLGIEKLESLRQQMQLLGKTQLLYHPGDRWVYGLGHDVQAYLVEHFSGMPLDQFLKKRMFEPLKMTDAVFGVPAPLAKRFANNYRPAPGGGLDAAETATTGVYQRFTTRPFGTVSMSSTVMDYARFSQMLLNGGELEGARLLSRKTVELMAQNHLPAHIPSIGYGSAPESGYGLGFSVVKNSAAEANLSSPGTFGWTGAATTRFLIDPAEDLVAVIYAQQMPIDRRLLSEFQTLVYQSIVD